MASEQYIDFISDLKQSIPAGQIYTDELRRLGWGTDASFYRMIPRVVVRSDGEAQMQTIMRSARKHNLPITFRAAGTSLSGQSVSDSILVVAGKNWEHYEVSADAESISLEPGIVGGKVSQILAPLGRIFPPDPASVNSAMVGGIVANNASGMSCGVHANSDHMLLSARLILSDGTLLDTGSKESRKAFGESHPEFIKKIEALRDKVRANKRLSDLIKYKYSIKNVTGLNIRPLVAYDDPFDIIAHSIVGSEGTLAFLSEVRMRTLRQYPHKASAMVYFFTMRESCEAVVAIKKLKASEEHLQWSAENQMVKCAEMLDYLSLASVDDPVYLEYKRKVDAGEIPGVEPGDYHNLTALLTETRATSEEELQQQIARITATLNQFNLYLPVEFTEDPAVYGRYWAIRSGIFPSVGGQRPVGTSCLIEDVAFHIDDLPEATVRLQKLIADHGYKDACIYGHAFEGNYHFILNQSFQTPDEVRRYEQMMRDVVRLVVEDYHGSLKAEHGTGRNMAPFVEYEWGKEAYAVMRELKDIFDPEHLLNPGVIFNDDPQCFIEHLKPLPVLNYDFEPIEKLDPNTSAKEMIDGVKKANKCIECGFCEVNCVSCGLTLSSRMRIAIQRHIHELETSGENPERVALLKKQYHYYGDQTCASDGLCATSCPMKINTGDLTHLIRQVNMMDKHLGYKVGNLAACKLSTIKKVLRSTLRLATLGQSILGNKAMNAICTGMHKAGLPQWNKDMPKAYKADFRLESRNTVASQDTRGAGLAAQDTGKTTGDLKVVYFPSCINQTMGLAKGAPVENTVVEQTIHLLHKAGYEVIFPKGMDNLCCGQIWESKGMMDIADRKTRELEDALWEASEQGRYPVLCDQSPCLHRMRKCITRMKLYEPVEFIMTYLKDRLKFHQIDRPVAVHITCSMREMGLGNKLIELAQLCSSHVLVPDGVGCCAFAGDKGFTHPELNQWALRKLKPQIDSNHIERGYSNSRTCEIGLQNNSGIPYMSIVYLVDECTASPNPLQ